MKHKIRDTQNISRYCMVCGVDNDFGLKTRFYETEDKEVVALFYPQEFHQSYPNITHGGITAAILDETIGRAIMVFYDRSTFGVNIELNVKYKRPVPYGVELKAVGRITNDSGRIFTGTGELYLPDGKLAASAEGKYKKRDHKQIIDDDITAEDWFTPAGVPDEL